MNSMIQMMYQQQIKSVPNKVCNFFSDISSQKTRNSLNKAKPIIPSKTKLSQVHKHKHDQRASTGRGRGGGRYHIEKRSMVPATRSIVTFLRWPPIQGGTDKIAIYFPNGTTPIYKNKALYCCCSCWGVLYNPC